MTIEFKEFKIINVPNNSVTQTDVFIYALGSDGIIYMTDAFCKNGWLPLMGKEETQ